MRLRRAPATPRPLLAADHALGLVFLGIKGYEYWEKYHDSLVPGVRFSYASPQAREAEPS